ncbi:hypothetical protein RND81_13G152000 [Saponaria officinalis]|uniref:F-box associated beta-propeller type 3 domain-containing protein n=1 Tax=Saponaria officinalis TaxID=3572 RepID=A0AAW1H0Y7_SAPOF
MLLKRNNTEMVYPEVTRVVTRAQKRRLNMEMADPQVTRARKRTLARKQSEDESHTFRLPEEILFNILLRVPAKLLHEVVRCVSTQLFGIVTDPMFVRKHRQMSNAGFLIQNVKDKSKISYIEADTTRLKLTEIQLPLPAPFMGSFNGFVLLHDLTKPYIFHVMNPVTKVNFSLPPMTGFCNYNSQVGFGITSSGLYKVVHISAKSTAKRVLMRVFTLGVDTTWLFIDLKGISIGLKEMHAFMFCPRFIAGFIYWINFLHFTGVALDVDTEIIYRFSPPEDLIREDIVRNDDTSIRFLSMGTCLGLFRQSQGGDTWRFWKLTCVKTNEWTEMARINIQPLLSRVDKMFYPSKVKCVWPTRLINGEFWFYRRVDEEFVMVRYDLVNESFSFFPITKKLERENG